ncbi:Hypothetical predicted protein [Paramuricea clavata]|uniref:Uncharacterized protein n=1 Tax=Paramuricea clavata TaxID=317549 RepID=A0A7D9DFJ3_PARCT|nr:Hypothetical predicted protein [Paramuricea clavata]
MDVKKTGYKADLRVTDGMDLRNQLRLVPTEAAKIKKYRKYVYVPTIMEPSTE